MWLIPLSTQLKIVGYKKQIFADLILCNTIRKHYKSLQFILYNFIY